MLQSLIVRSLTPLSILFFALFVAACGSAPTNQPASNVPATAPSPAAPVASKASTAKLNLNTASDADFMTIPGMTQRMVHEFTEYRPYQSIQQFRREMAKYVSQAVIADYEKYVFVPISENDSDAPTLQQIPGIDAAEAAALIAGRPYAARDAFVAKLSGMVSKDELTIAKTYFK